jgi:uncharacterized membrane protein YcfT
MSEALVAWDIVRVFGMALAGITFGLAVAEAKLYLCRWRDRDMYVGRLPYMISMRIGIALSAVFIFATLISRLGEPVISWRSIFGCVILAFYMVGMIGILLDDQNFQDTVAKIQKP